MNIATTGVEKNKNNENNIFKSKEIIPKKKIMFSNIIDNNSDKSEGIRISEED